MKSLRRFGSGLGCALLLVVGSAHAQEAAPAPEATPEPEILPTVPVEPQSPEADPVPRAKEPEGAVKLDDIVVTVTKRKQAARDVPSSMAVLQGEKLEQLGYRELKELFTLVPGINMTDEIAGIQRKISVRGVGPDTGTNQTVGSVMGDIPISDPYGATTIIDPNPWDMRTVEILKGPQGTLFGATSLAGLIRYVPNAPELGRFAGKAFHDYTMVDMGGKAGAYGAALNVPIGESIALRASGILQNRAGVLDSENPARMEEDINSGRSYSWRAMALWQPTERFTVNAWYTEDERHWDDLNIVTYSDGSYVRRDAPAPSPMDNRFKLATLDLRYAFDWATLVSLSGYQRKDSHTLVETSYLIQPLAEAGVSYARTRRDVETRGFLEELRLMSPETSASALSWIVGALHSTFEQDILAQLYVTNTEQLNLLRQLLPLPILDGYITENGLTGTQTGYRPLEAVESAVYGEANYDFTRSLRLTVGSRLYRTSANGTLRATGASSGNNGAEPGTTEKGWSPKVAVTYRPWKDVLTYATISRGFQFGGFNLPTVSTPDIPLRFKSSILWNYETGIRTDWFDRTLRIDLTGFFLDWKNPQVSQSSMGVNTYVDNVGRTHSLGAEATIRWLTPLKGLSIEESASYIEARTREPFDDASGVTVPVGTIMPSSPLVQSVTTLAYTQSFGPWIGQASLIYSMKSTAWGEITHETEVGDYGLLGFNFNLKRISASFSPALTLSVNNITNVQTVVAGFGPPGGAQRSETSLTANSTYAYSQPRSIVVRVSADF